MSNDGGGTDARGRLVGERYRLIERIGSGGMGTVWRAFDELVEREVAVKQPRLPGDPEDDTHRRAAHRLYREARAAARVDHPAAVTIHDVVVEAEGPGGLEAPNGSAGPGGVNAVDGHPWIVMELVRGESLHEVLRRGPLPPAEAARIGLAVLGALRAAHAVGIVHRDVKPANVLLGSHGRVVLTDFGIAHVQGEESLTASGEFIGSLEFVAPERMSGRGAGPASDLWSLGVLLYAAVEGRSPFRRTTPESTLAAILATDPPEPKQAGPLAPLIVRLLVKDPEERPDAEEVAKLLEATAGRGPAAESARVSHPAPVPEHNPIPGPTPEPGSLPRPTREPDPLPDPDLTTTSIPLNTPPLKHRTLLRPAPLALLGALLLVGGMWSATRLGGTDGGTVAEQAVRATPTTTASDADAWVSHRETDLGVVLFLPRQYKWMNQVGETNDDPLIGIYGDGGVIQVRIARWNEAPRSLLAEARATVDIGAGHDRTGGQYTRTSFHGHEAVLADTTYDPHGTPVRVLRLLIRADGGRMYELRVDMPKGTPEEKEGTAVFQGARDRLQIVKD